MAMNIKFHYYPWAPYPWHWYYSPQGEEFPEVMQWIVQTYGFNGERWEGNGGWLMFKEESDAMMFLLRWS